MIQVSPVRFDKDGWNFHIRTHILTPRIGVQVAFSIEWKKESVLSVLEDHILETISSTEWKTEDSDKDFMFLTENYNFFIKNLDPRDLSDISLVISVLENTKLTISAIWYAAAFLVEGEEVTQITEPEKWRTDFHTMTAGEVGRNAHIFVATRNIEHIFGSDLLIEFANQTASQFQKEMLALLDREYTESLHTIRYWYDFSSTKPDTQRKTVRARGQIDLLKNRLSSAKEYIQKNDIYTTAKEKIQDIDFKKNTKQRYIFLGIWAVLLFFMAYTVLRSMGSVLGMWGIDGAKSEITKVQTLIDESRKLTWNQVAFDKNIAEAESIISSLQSQKKYLVDIARLQNDIAALKRESYDIQIVDLSGKQSVVAIKDNFIPLQTFENNNKLIVIGKNGLISDYVKASDKPKITPYPQNDTAINATISDKWVPYIISGTNKIMSLNTSWANYVNLSGQEGWEVGKNIFYFNGNIYLLNDSQTQIYKHKPASNGFAAKTNVFSKLSEQKILDFAIDGGYYFLMADGKIWRYLPTKDSDWILSLTLNKLKGGWSIDSKQDSEIISNDKLSYVYVRNGKKLWIFKPNSKNFQDVKSLDYISELEFNTPNTINSITIPRDGLIYISTDSAVYETQFEVSNDKLILK